MAEIIDLVALSGANFAFIFLKAFQQRNVAHLNWFPVLPTSFLMAVAEVVVIGSVAKAAIDGSIWGPVVALSLGGGLGCLCSMYVHSRIFRK